MGDRGTAVAARRHGENRTTRTREPRKEGVKERREWFFSFSFPSAASLLEAGREEAKEVGCRREGGREGGREEKHSITHIPPLFLVTG